MKILKIIILQTFWYLSIKFGQTVIFPLLGGLIFMADFFVFKKENDLQKSYLIFSLTLVVTGILMDKGFEYLKLLTWGNQFYPFELLGVWIIFPCYYYQFFNKFSSPWFLSFLLGAVFGPIAYLSGGSINSNLNLDSSFTTVSFLCLFWGLFFGISNLLFYKKVLKKII